MVVVSCGVDAVVVVVSCSVRAVVVVVSRCVRAVVVVVVERVDARMRMRRCRECRCVLSVKQICVEPAAGAVGSRNNCHQLRRRQIDRRSSACAGCSAFDRRRRHAGQLGVRHCAICQFRRRHRGVGKLRRANAERSDELQILSGVRHRHHARRRDEHRRQADFPCAAARLRQRRRSCAFGASQPHGAHRLSAPIGA